MGKGRKANKKSAKIQKEMREKDEKKKNRSIKILQPFKKIVLRGQRKKETRGRRREKETRRKKKLTILKKLFRIPVDSDDEDPCAPAAAQRFITYLKFKT